MLPPYDEDEDEEQGLGLPKSIVLRNPSPRMPDPLALPSAAVPAVPSIDVPSVDPGQVDPGQIDPTGQTRYTTPIPPMNFGRAPAMELLGRIPTPEYEELPRRQYQPGFKGAMMDALRGMIPGYNQAFNQVLQQERADVAARNARSMEIYKQRMDILQPMLSEQYKQEVTFQNAQAMYNHLTATRPQMPEWQKWNYAFGHSSAEPRAMTTPARETVTFRDGNSMPVFVHPGGIVSDLNGNPLPNKLVDQIDYFGAPQAPSSAVVRGEVPVFDQAGQPVMERDPLTGERKQKTEAAIFMVDRRTNQVKRLKYGANFIGGAKDQWAEALKSTLVTSRVLENQKKTQDLEDRGAQELNAYETKQRNDIQDDYLRLPQTKEFAQVASRRNAVMRMDRKNPLNQTVIIRDLAKVTDAMTGVREGEQVTFERFSMNIPETLWRDAKRLWDSKVTMPPEAFERLVAAVEDRFRSYHSDFLELRKNYIGRMRGALGGRVDAERYLPDVAAPFENRQKVLNSETGKYETWREYYPPGATVPTYQRVWTMDDEPQRKKPVLKE